MSARSHVDVNERRLRLIYDCLDNGNNKKALQEADKVLKKQKDFLCAKVLKALALLRVGRLDESTDLLSEVHALKPTEDATLLAMGIAYRELNKVDLIVEMYENAHRELPNNEEVLSSLFMAYVRLSDYKKQQQIAMKLHRLHPSKNPYYFWAVMSIVMQAHMDKKLAKIMYLPLAERMASKYVVEERVEAEAEVQMYLIVLEQLSKYKEALDIVRGPLGDKLTSDPRFQKAKEAELLVKLERWDEANRAYKMLLLENNDDWSHYKAYFKTSFAMMEAKWTPTEKKEENKLSVTADHTLEAVVLFLEEQLRSATMMKYTPRGPYLAYLLLLQHLRQRNIPVPESLGSAEDQLRQYLVMFGDRPCCFSDLKLFMDLLSAEQVKEMVAALTGELGLNPGPDGPTMPQDVSSLQRHLNLLQLAQCSGLHDHLDEAEQCAFSEQLIARYKAGLLLGEGLHSTDLQYSDNYLILACHTMMEVYLCNGDRSLLWRAIVLLEKALISSPSNFQIKLLLITFYSRLGCGSPSAVLYESMRIRNILNDSMGYTVVNHMCRLGHFSAAASIYGAMLRFFTVNHKETTEYLTASYKFGSFSKIYEFVLFRERLENSLQFASALVERLLLDLTQNITRHQVTERMLLYMDMDPVTDKTKWDDLRDNRDLTVMLTWHSPNKILKDAHKVQSFKEEVAWLRVRKLILRCLATANSITDRDVPNNNALGNGDATSTCIADVLRQLTKELRTHVTECENSLPTLTYPVCGPSPSRLTSYIKGQYVQCLLQALELVLYVYSIREHGFDKADKTREESMDLITTQLKGHVADGTSRVLPSKNDAVTFDPQGLEQVVHTAELMCYLAILMGTCHRILKPLKSEIIKRNKKKKESNPPALPLVFTKFNSVVLELSEVVKAAVDSLVGVDLELLANHFQEMTLTTPETEEDVKFESELRNNMRMSYEQSLKEVRNLMDSKRTYLSDLIL